MGVPNLPKHRVPGSASYRTIQECSVGYLHPVHFGTCPAEHTQLCTLLGYIIVLHVREQYVGI